MGIKHALLLVIVICSFNVKAQYTTDQINRLADAGKLWGYINYFHPYLRHKTINWDSAFVANVPSILSSNRKKEYEGNLQNLLSVLKDPVTRVLTQIPESTVQPITFNVSDSILYISIPDLRVLENSASVAASGFPWEIGSRGKPEEDLKKAFINLDAVKGVVFDLRSDFVPATVVAEDLNSLLFTSGIGKLINGVIPRPASRSVIYYNAFLFGSYFYPNFHIEAKYSNRFNGTQVKPMVFITNNYTLLPRVATSLQAVSKAAILNQQNGGDISVGGGKDIRFFLQDSVIVKMRIGDIINDDGSVGIHANEFYSPEATNAEIRKKAVQMFSSPFMVSNRPAAPETPSAVLPDYSRDTSFPSIGYRALAAAMIYGVIDNFFPYKKLMDKDWETSYKKVFPKIIQAKNWEEYIKAVAELYAHIDDGHGRINHKVYSSIIHTGRNNSPIVAKVVEGKYIVTGILHDSAASTLGISKGDLIKSINGKDPVKLIDELRKYRAASNKDAQTNYLAEGLLRGEEDEVKQLLITKPNGKEKLVALPISKKYNLKETWLKVNERYFEKMLRFITPDVGYADLNKLAWYEVDSMFNMFKNTKAIIFDMRGYPQGAGFHIGPRLSEKTYIKGATFSTLAPAQPNVKIIGNSYHDVERWMSMNGYSGKPGGFIYKGKTVMLIDESAESQAEGTAMGAKNINNTTLIGNNTAGANGDVTGFTIPGNVHLTFSGDAISWPDGRQAQRIGIVPDIRVRPTIKGIQAGKDEVLERAIKFLQTGK